MPSLKVLVSVLPFLCVVMAGKYKLVQHSLFSLSLSLSFSRRKNWITHTVQLIRSSFDIFYLHCWCLLDLRRIFQISANNASFLCWPFDQFSAISQTPFKPSQHIRKDQWKCKVFMIQARTAISHNLLVYLRARYTEKTLYSPSGLYAFFSILISIFLERGVY